MFTYKKVSYLNDPYQQYLSSKAAKQLNKNNASINTKNGLLTPPSPNYKSTLNVDSIKTKNGLLAPPSSESTTRNNNSLLAPPSTNTEKNVSLSEIDNSNKTINKHSSFINPLLDMKFDVGSLFGDGDKSSDDLFGAILSKYDKLEEEKKKNEENSIENTPKLGELNKSIEEIKKENRVSQDTIKMKRSSTIKRDCTITSRSTVKGDTSTVISSAIQSDKHSSQDTIKLIQEKAKKIDSFDNQLVQKLNAQPTITADNSYLNEVNEEENNGFNPDIYEDDDKIDMSYSNDWVDSYRSKNDASSVKSSQSKLSAFSSFTIKSTKKLGKMTKNLYKKFTKQKPAPQFPTSPLDIPSSYNEKERAFEEMILRDDTISLSLSNPNGTLTSTFADKAFPLTENINENETENNEAETENDNSFASSLSSYEGEGLDSKKRRHRNGINFEEALKEGNQFRVSLANL